MPGLLDGILDQLGPDGVSQIANTLGADESTVNSAIAAALPTIIAGMARNTQSPDGAASLSNALDDHDPSIFGQLGDLLGGGGDGAAILGHVFGTKEPKVEQNISQQSGLDLATIMKLMSILAPLVMGYLSREKQKQGLDASTLPGVLDQERQAEEIRQPGLGGLASLLDADGDGSIIDDVMGKLTGR
jgi:hypothetical protein